MARPKINVKRAERPLGNCEQYDGECECCPALRRGCKVGKKRVQAMRDFFAKQPGTLIRPREV
jgi:hypothetical protein